MKNRKKLKRIYFGGTEEEITQAFDDMGILDIIFTHWSKNGGKGVVDGFSYYTINPRLPGLKLTEDPTNTGAVIAHKLAKELLNLPPPVPPLEEGKRRVWTLRLMMKDAEFAVFATDASVSTSSSYTVERRATSLKLN